MTQLSPMQIYKQQLAEEKITPDADQRTAMEHLNRIYMELTVTEQARKHWFFKSQKLKPVKGLYMYGGVGRGKTMMMDIFFESLPTHKKMRLHFYRFMAMVHKELKSLKGEANPLPIVAKNLAKKTKIICFDEFIVEDIADAMILGLLFKALFNEGICLVATSNIEPDHLYEGGLQRDRFSPAIEVLKKNVEVLNVDSGNDYRIDEVITCARYFTPLEGERDFMQAQFDHLTDDAGKLCPKFELQNRQVQTLGRTHDVVWFDFDELCSSPRGAADYIQLADEYRIVLLSNVPQMYESLNSAARRFVSLIDELYDNDIILILSAQVPIAELYTGKQLTGVFERTKSRLVEMQKT